MMTDDAEPFFRRDGDYLIPTEQASGPWKAGSLHGRAVVGVLAAEIENRHGDPEFMPARVTVDLHSPAMIAPLEVRTTVVRDGRRIRVVDAELVCEGRAVARASCQFLRRSSGPGGRRWHGETWAVPPPESFEQVMDSPETMNGRWDFRWISGNFGVAEQSRAWMREVRPMIGGEEPTPFMRLMAGADNVSPMTMFGEGAGSGFINSDLTIYLVRLPVSEWIGYEALAQEEHDGIAIGHCNIYDTEGRIGWGSACALGQQYRGEGREKVG